LQVVGAKQNRVLFLQPDAARYYGRAISSNKKIKDVRSRGVVDAEQRKPKIDHNSSKEQQQQQQQEKKRSVRAEHTKKGLGFRLRLKKCR
jgi:hypothetical protein